MTAGPPGLASRRAAWRLLELVRQGRPFEAAKDEALAELIGPDRRLAHELAAGTLRAAGALDQIIAPFVDHGLGAVPAPLRDLLRLGAYQLTSLDRIPPHAAVSTAVALAREHHRRAAPFVNAVLRKVAAEAPRLVPGRGTHPGWLVSRWTSRFGPAAAARLLAWNDTRPALSVQPARWSRDQLVDAWRQAGIRFEDAPFGAGLLPAATRPADLPGFQEGGFYVQDPSQALVVRYFDLLVASRVYDAAAAPGGKAIGLGERAALVLAGDRDRSRVRRLQQNLARAGSGREHALLADALHPPVVQVDAAVLDAPCLGTGVFARHPDARWRVRPEALDRLADRAGVLLRSVAETVRVGGLLCFSTCSLEPEENEMQVEAFLLNDDRFCREPGPAPEGLRSAEGDLVVLPHRDSLDGAYAARLRRIR